MDRFIDSLTTRGQIVFAIVVAAFLFLLLGLAGVLETEPIAQQEKCVLAADGTDSPDPACPAY